MGVFYLSGQLEEPGSVAWVKEVFQHTNADRKIKDFNANKSLLQVTTARQLLQHVSYCSTSAAAAHLLLQH